MPTAKAKTKTAPKKTAAKKAAPKKAAPKKVVKLAVVKATKPAPTKAPPKVTPKPAPKAKETFFERMLRMKAERHAQFQKQNEHGHQSYDPKMPQNHASFSKFAGPRRRAS